MTRSWQVSDEAALQVRCRKCGVKPGEMCIRVVQSAGPWHWSDEHGDTIRIVHEVGDVCQRTHNERRRTAANRRMQAIRDAWKREHAAEMAEAAEVSAARAGWAHAARLEHQQLASWLREHGHVLWDVAPREEGAAVPGVSSPK